MALSEPRPRGGTGRIERVVLLGFMGAGKTVVGRALAARLGWRHVDLDEHIEREQGRSVAALFRAEGEAAFRALEARTTERLAGERELVLSPGGGWITQPALLDRLGAGTLSVWLRAAWPEVLRRLGPEERARRPLLQGPDAEARALELFRSREPLYARAALHVDTEGREVEQIVRDIATRVRA